MCVSASTKRLMCVPLNSFGKSTNMPMVATVFCTLRAFVAHLDGKPQPAHAHLVNPQFAVIGPALHVMQMRGGIFFRRAKFYGVAALS